MDRDLCGGDSVFAIHTHYQITLLLKEKSNLLLTRLKYSTWDLNLDLSFFQL